MPDVREVYEMFTKQKPPEPGALQRQQKRQVRSARSKKIGAFAVAAAIGLAALVLILVNLPGNDTTTPAGVPSAVAPADAAAVPVTLGFLGAYGAFDAEEAITYLADDADITGMIEEQGPGGIESLSLELAFWEAMGYEQTVKRCEATPSGSDTSVSCWFDFHGIRSDEIGLGPFDGSSYTFTVRDGEIVTASRSLNYAERFSPQMWEPFADWVRTTHPKDYAVMYTDGGTNFRLSEESIRLWEKRTKEYVTVLNRGTAGQ